MRLVSFVVAGGPPRLGALLGDPPGAPPHEVCDLAAASAAMAARHGGGWCLPHTIKAFLCAGAPALLLAQETLAWVAQARGGPAAPFVTTAARLVAPVPRPGKVLALAGNYQAHVAEGGGQRVDKTRAVPKVFIKPATTIAGPGQPLALPERVSRTVDWELELVAVVGRPARYVAVEDALDYVAGYTIGNDVSSRSLAIVERRATTEGFDEFFDWLNGKWQDGFALTGPALVTRDEVPDPQRLDLELRVNGQVRQQASTADMIFTVAETIAWTSALMTLEPGDLLFTGTPSGVGDATGTFLRPGDVLEGRIAGLGVLTNPVTAEPAPGGG